MTAKLATASLKVSAFKTLLNRNHFLLLIRIDIRSKNIVASNKKKDKAIGIADFIKRKQGCKLLNE